MSNISDMVNSTIMGVITLVIFIAVLVALGPTVISSVANINMTTLADVPLGSVIVLLATYFPAFYYLAGVLAAIGAVWGFLKIKG